MLIWSAVLMGILALFFFNLYPRSDYIKTVEKPIAQTPIVQFTTQHKNALDLALRSVKTAAERKTTTYAGYGTFTNDLTIKYPDFAELSKDQYLPQGLNQADWIDAPQSFIVCAKYDSATTPTVNRYSSANNTVCSLGGYTNSAQTTVDTGTRDYLITWAPKPTDYDFDGVFPGWPMAWRQETRSIDTCGIVKNQNGTLLIQSEKCDGGFCNLTDTNNPARLSKLNLNLPDGAFVCISPIDHYAYDGVSITGKNRELIANYDGINNTWAGHSNTTTTWYDMSGNGNDGIVTTSAIPPVATSTSSWNTHFLKVHQTTEPVNYLASPLTSLYPKLTIQTATWIDLLGTDKSPIYIFGSRDRSQNGDLASSAGLELQLTRSANSTYSNTFAFYEADGTSIISPRITKKQNFAYPLTLTFKRNLTQYGVYINDEGGTVVTGPEPLSGTSFGRLGFMYTRTWWAAPAYLFGMRIYQTPLTAAQIALNYKIDQKRFNLPQLTNANGDEYTNLEGDGSAYINTTYLANSQTKYRVVVQANSPAQSTAYYYIMGANSAAAKTFSIAIRGGNLGFGAFYVSSYYYSYITPNNTKKTIELDQNKLYIDGTLKKEFTLDSTINHTGDFTDYLFASRNTSSTSKLVGKIYEAQIYENNILQRNFIPAADPFGRPAMYDTVTGKFFYNANTSGKFTLGTN